MATYPRSLWRTSVVKQQHLCLTITARSGIKPLETIALARATFSIRFPNHGTICHRASAIPLCCYEQQKNQMNASVSFKLPDAFRKGA